MPGFHIIFSLVYPVLRHRIHRTYVGSAAQVGQAGRDLDAAMGEIEKKREHRQYLVGAEFSRADLSLASMLSLLVMLPEHPFAGKEIRTLKTESFMLSIGIIRWLSGSEKCVENIVCALRGQYTEQVSLEYPGGGKQIYSPHTG